MSDFSQEHGSAPDHETVTDDELFADEASNPAHASPSPGIEDRVPLLAQRAESHPQRKRPRPIAVGELLAGKYRVERVHAPGLFGTTVEALHVQLEQRVAIKLSLADARAFPARSERFLRAARLAAPFRNEHTARIIDIDSLDSGTPYVVVEHFSGTDLRGVLRVREWLPPAEAIDYLLQACEGLAEAHVAGLVHRNLKPSNLFLARALDGRPTIKVLDFALLDDASAEGLVATSDLVDSLAYLAPEQFRDPSLVDVRTDIWALGAVLHELLTGSPVYAASAPPGLFAAIAADAPTPITHLRPELPAELEDVVLRCLEKETQARYPDLGTLVRQLRPFAAPHSQDAVERIIMVLERRTRSTRLSSPPSLPPAASARREIVRVEQPLPPPGPRRALELGLAALAVVGLSVGIAAFIVVHNLHAILAARAVIERPMVASFSPALPAATPVPTPRQPANTATPASPALPSAIAAARVPIAAVKAPTARASARSVASVESTPYDEGPHAAVAAPGTSAQALFENPN